MRVTSSEHLARLADGERYEKGGALDRALDAYGAAAAADDSSTVAAALLGMARVHRHRSDWDTAIRYAEQSAGVAREAGLDGRLAEALNEHAAALLSRGDFGPAVELLQTVLEVAGDERMRGVALLNLGGIAAQTGALAEAESRFEASIECFRRAGYEWGLACALNNTGRAALDRGDVERADEVLACALTAARHAGDGDLIALARVNLAAARAALGDIDEGLRLLGAAVGYYASIGNRWRQAECLRLLGDMHRRTGDLETARRSYARGLELAAEVGGVVEQRQLEELLASLG